MGHTLIFGETWKRKMINLRNKLVESELRRRLDYGLMDALKYLLENNIEEGLTQRISQGRTPMASRPVNRSILPIEMRSAALAKRRLMPLPISTPTGPERSTTPWTKTATLRPRTVVLFTFPMVR